MSGKPEEGQIPQDIISFIHITLNPAQPTEIIPSPTAICQDYVFAEDAKKWLPSDKDQRPLGSGYIRILQSMRGGLLAVEVCSKAPPYQVEIFPKDPDQHLFLQSMIS